MTRKATQRSLPKRIGVLMLCWLATGTEPGFACPFCTQQGQTLTQDVGQASMVLFGTLSNARLDPNGAFGQGATDLKIEAVVKQHEILKDQKVITLPRYVPSDNTKAKFLIFC